MLLSKVMGEEVANECGVSARNTIRVRVATSPEDLDDESIDQEVEFVHQVRWCRVYIYILIAGWFWNTYSYSLVIYTGIGKRRR